MPSLAKIAANIANAMKSTGPRTGEGKARSAANSTRHGFRSQSVLIPGDDPAEYQLLLDQLTIQYKPDDLATIRLVREMADAEWRLRRSRTHQERIVTDKIAEIAQSNPNLDPLGLQIRAFEDLTNTSAYYRQLVRYEEKFERQYNRAVRDLAAHRRDQIAQRRIQLDRRLEAALATPAPSNRTNEANGPSRPPSTIDTNEANPLRSGLLRRYNEGSRYGQSLL